MDIDIGHVVTWILVGGFAGSVIGRITTGSKAGFSACSTMMRDIDSPWARAVRMNGLRNTSIMLPRMSRAM